MQIGLAGTGRLGGAMCRRLLELGHAVAVWNRTAERAQPLMDLGATRHDTPRQLAQASDVVLTVLADAGAIERTYLGQDGLLAGDVAGRIFVEMSTVRPHVQHALETRVTARGARLVECPVGGASGAALEGKLLGLAGGKAGDIEEVKPVLAALCSRLEHVGPVGAGASMKLAINLPLIVYWQALSEALSLVQHLGLSPERLISIMADTSGAPRMLQARGKAIADALSGSLSGPVQFSVAVLRKDLRTMLEEAQSRGASLPVVDAALQCFDRAAHEGHDQSDGLRLPAIWLARTP
jgi:3-hydroxyisobutyrate dehydrogenase